MAADSRIKWPGWETVRLIGQGNYGAVYEIQQISTQGIEKAALKFVSIPRKESEIEKLLSEGHDRTALTRRYENYLRGIVEEYAHLTEAKDHPNIVCCDEVRYNRHPDGIGWDVLIKMPLLTPLMTAMNQIPAGALSDTVLRVGRDISCALAFCDARKLQHRDIKPQNIFADAQGRYMLGDFGIAGLYEGIWREAGISTGISAFMAPEICNRQPYGSKADVYSLGLTLYYLLNERRLPFVPLPPAVVTPELANEALNRRLRGEALPPPKSGDPRLKALVMLACVFDPQKRCSAAELWEGMKALSANTAAGGEAPARGSVILPAAQVQTPPAARPAAQAQTPPAARTAAQAQTPPAARTAGQAQTSPAARTAAQAQTPPVSRMAAPAPAAAKTQTVRSQGSGKTARTGKNERKPNKSEGENRNKRRALWIVLVGVALVLIVGIAILAVSVFGSLFGRGRDPKPSPVSAATEAPEISPEPTAKTDPAATADPGTEPVVVPTDGADPEPEDEPVFPELVWSHWDDHLPSKVSGENSAIEMRLVYRSVPLLEVVDGDSPGSPYIKAEELTEYSDFDYENAYTTEVRPKEDDLTQWTEEPVTESVWSEWKCWVQDYQTPKGKYQERANFSGKDAITWKGVAYSRIYREYLGERTVRVIYTVVKRHRTDYYYDSEAWSEYTPVPIAQEEGVLVASKMQYRYAAAENGVLSKPSMENFPVFDADYSGRFRDVPPDMWYAPENSSILRTVCELGILLPDRIMNFRPEDPVTLGQVIRAAVMIHRIYTGSAQLLSENNGDYQSYLDYAVEHGLLRQGEMTELEREATRQEMAYLFSRALPEEELKAERKEITEITDMDKSDAYYAYALLLARANVITLQRDGTFKPQEGATRAQLASIVDKLVYPQHRTAAD